MSCTLDLMYNALVEIEADGSSKGLDEDFIMNVFNPLY